MHRAHLARVAAHHITYIKQSVMKLDLVPTDGADDSQHWQLVWDAIHDVQDALMNLAEAYAINRGAVVHAMKRLVEHGVPMDGPNPAVKKPKPKGVKPRA